MGHAVALVSLLLLLTALGRLVYPVVEAAPSDDVVVLLASLVTGSVHLALLGLAVAALALPPQPRSPLRHAGIPFGALFVLGSFPWMLPTWLNLGVALGVACWGWLPVLTLRRDDGSSDASSAGPTDFTSLVFEVTVRR